MKYKCIKSLEPGNYFTKGRIYNIILSNNSEDINHFIESFDNNYKGHKIHKYWWNTFHSLFLKEVHILNINIKIL